MLIQRVKKLEKQSRRTKWFAVVIVTAVVLPWSLGAVNDPKNQTVSGRRFVLIDGKGNLRMFLGADDDDEGRVGLYLYDQVGKRSAALYVKKGQNGLVLYGKNNKERARLYLDEQEVGLSFYDKSGREQTRFSQGRTVSRLALGVSRTTADADASGSSPEPGDRLLLSFDSRENGLSVISMGDRQAGSHIQLEASKDRSHLLLRNREGNRRVQLSPATDSPSMKLNTSHDVPGIAIFDPEGRVISQLP